MSVLYHHRGNLDELLKLDRWWRQTKCSVELYVKLDEDDEELPEVASHFKSGGFLPQWTALIGPRRDDAFDLTTEFHIVMGVDAARDLALVTHDPTRIALFLLLHKDTGEYDEQ